jgi:hypothetical protein
MGRYVFSKKAEENLIDIYRYGFINHSERQANQYSDSLGMMRFSKYHFWRDGNVPPFQSR